MKKIREKIRKFRVSEKGFTLVELIVVIAIIGILAAIGTVAYSGYIESANQAADEQVMADFSYAVQLGAADAGLSNSNPEEDWATVTYDPEAGTWEVEPAETVDAEDAEAEDAEAGDSEETTEAYSGVSYYAETLSTTAVFEDEEDLIATVEGWLEDGVGENWKTEELKSDLYTTQETVIGVPSGEISNENLATGVATYLSNYSESNFYGNEETLMTAVDSVTSVFGSMVGEGEDGAETLQGLLGLSDEDWAEFCETYGIGTYDEETDTWDYSDVTSTELGNAMVLYMASAIDSQYGSDSGESFVELIQSGDTITVSEDNYDELWSYMTLLYGTLSSYRLSDYCTDSFAETYDAFLEMDTSTSSNSEIMSAFLTLLMSSDDGYEEYIQTEDFAEDTTAFVSLMSALTELSTTDEDFINSFSDLSTVIWSNTNSSSEDSSTYADMYSYIMDLLEEYGY